MAAELAAELTADEVLAVQHWLRAQPEEAAAWLRRYSGEVEWLMSAAPAKRRTRASLRGPERPRLLWWAVTWLTRGAAVAQAMAQAPLPETASHDRSNVGAVLNLLELAEETLPVLLEQPIWNEHGEYWS